MARQVCLSKFSPQIQLQLNHYLFSFEQYYVDNFDKLKQAYNYCIAEDTIIDSIISKLNIEFDTENLIVDGVKFIKVNSGTLPSRIVLGNKGFCKVSLKNKRIRKFLDVVNNRVYLDERYNIQAVVDINYEIKPHLIMRPSNEYR